MCIEFIYRHIRQLPSTQIVTTRELLIYGRRSAVDVALHRLVKSGFIVRLARGVFVRDISNPPTMLEIVTAKAKAFKTQITTHAETILHKLNISSSDSDQKFARNGHSSSFLTIHGRAYLQGICGRKLALSTCRVGEIIYALWHFGSGRCSTDDISQATKTFGRNERNLLWLASSLMPAWLNEICRHRYPLTKIRLRI